LSELVFPADCPKGGWPSIFFQHIHLSSPAILASRREFQFYAPTGSRQHIDQCLDTEKIDSPAYKVTHTRLGNSKEIGGRTLRQFVCTAPDRNTVLESDER